MTEFVDPTVCKVEEFCPDLDSELVVQARSRGVEYVADIPKHYRTKAAATNSAVRGWVTDRVREACQKFTVAPTVMAGRSLCLLGGVGRGKTHQAFGAIRAFGVSGVRCRWVAVSAPNLYAQLRPRPGVDSETVFLKYAATPMLVLDDVGAEKTSEWVEEVNARVVDYRWEAELPTIFTSNCTPQKLNDQLGARVMSRIAGMSTVVVLDGPDRRRQL